jgi:hypothetical protein
MHDILADGISVVIGVVTSLVGWWIIYRGLTPKILLSTKISKIPETERHAEWRYRFKIANTRRWLLPNRSMIDVKVAVMLQFRGLYPEALENLLNYRVPVAGDGTIPVIRDDYVLRLKIEDIALTDASLLGRKIQENGWRGLDLDELLQLGEETRLRVMVTGTDAYTHATTTKIAYYRRNDLERGRFSKNRGRSGLRIVAKQVEEDKIKHNSAANDVGLGHPAPPWLGLLPPDPMSRELDRGDGRHPDSPAESASLPSRRIEVDESP